MHTAQGIIIKRDDFRERDERIVLYTKDLGKISVVAKGTKRIEAKLRGSLDIFNLVDITFVEGSNFFILTGVDVLERHPNIIKNTYSYSAALSAARTVSHIFEENAKDREFFNIFQTIFKKVDEYGKEEEQLYLWVLLKSFEVLLLETQGYKIDKSALSSFNIEVPSENIMFFLDMLQGAEHSSATLSKREFLSIDKLFERIFSYLFNYKTFLWIPTVQ